MIKIDLARTIAEQMNIHTKDAETFLTTFTDIVSDSLASGEPVRLTGFGTFDIRHVAAHEARNPKKRRTCSSPGHILPHLPCRKDTEGQGSELYVFQKTG